MSIRDKYIVDFVATAREIGDRGLTRCSSGNLSWRVGDKVLISSTGSWLPELRDEQVSICSLETGESLNGVRPSMEATFHFSVMRNRPEVNVVLHCQSPYATTIACMKSRPVDFNVTAEIPIHCGKHIPVIPYFRPGSPELAVAVIDAMQEHDSILLEKHGQVFAGEDFKQAIERAEFLEMACGIIINSAMQYLTLTDEDVADLDAYVSGKK